MTFTYQVNVTVEIEGDNVNVTSSDIKETLHDCISIDLDTENGENVLPDGSQITGISIEW